MHYDLIAIASRSTVEVGCQCALGQQAEGVGAALAYRGRPARVLSRPIAGHIVLVPFRFLIEPLPRRLQRPLHDRAQLGRQPTANDQHPVFVNPGRQTPSLVLPPVGVGRRDPVDPAPGPRQPFDMRGRP